MNIHGVWSCCNRLIISVSSLSAALRSKIGARRGAETHLSNDEIQVTKYLRADLPLQSEEQFTDLKWAVMRQPHQAQPTSCRGTEAVAHLHREWGGEFAMRRYYTTAAAKMLTERFGADLGKFLSVVDKADPADLIDLLRESVGCRQATSDAPERLQTDDEPTLPFMDAVQSTGGSVPHC